MSAFGDVFRGPAEPVFSDELIAKVLIKEKEFWAGKQNRTVRVIRKNKRTKPDLTVEYLTPTVWIPITIDGCTFYPLSQINVRNVDADLREDHDEILHIAFRKVGALDAGANTYHRLLMRLRRLSATTQAQRDQLLNSQQHELRTEYFQIYGIPLGRYYFSLRTLRDVVGGLRKLGLYAIVAAAVWRAMHWLGGPSH